MYFIVTFDQFNPSLVCIQVFISLKPILVTPRFSIDYRNSSSMLDSDIVNTAPLSLSLTKELTHMWQTFSVFTFRSLQNNQFQWFLISGWQTHAKKTQFTCSCHFTGEKKDNQIIKILTYSTSETNFPFL